MIQTIAIGSSPANEACAQLGDEGYSLQARKECKVYCDQLYAFLEKRGHSKESLPESFFITTKGNSHDFGTYYEVVVKFDDKDPRVALCEELAFLLENGGPMDWDAVSCEALGLDVWDR